MPSSNRVSSARATNKLLDAALAYAREGWRVLPLHSVARDGTCSCSKGADCTGAGKHPRILSWKDEATADTEQVREWWEQWPDANIGVATGAESGLLVLDFDQDSEATREIAALLPPTVTAQTGKGTHYYFSLPADLALGNGRGTLPPGIDVRGDGGFAVAPPSRHKSGRAYAWRDGPDNVALAELPAAVVDRLQGKRVHRAHATQTNQPRPGHPGTYWLKRAVEKVQAGEPRNETGFWLACQLRDDGLSQEIAEPILLDYAAEVRDMGDHEYEDSEAVASLQQAFARQARAPAVAASGQALEEHFVIGTELPDAPEAARELELPVHYGISDTATMHRKPGRGTDGEPEWRWEVFAYAPVLITGILHDIETGAESLRLAWKRGEEWRDEVVSRKTAVTPHELLTLADKGFPVDGTTAQAMTKYLTAFEAQNYARLPKERVSHHLGWQGRKKEYGFLWGKKQLAVAGSDKVTFQGKDEGDTQVAGGFHAHGTLEGWLDAIQPLLDYPKVLFGLYAAFVPPLLGILDCESFVVDYNGRTSTGKTTALRVAASVVGCPDESRRAAAIATWNTTTVAAERRCGLLTGLPVIFDDSRKAKYRDTVRDVVYQFSGGQGKGRGTLTGLEQTATFRSVLLSSGEEAAVDFTTAAGVRGRVISLRGLPLESDEVGDLVRMLNEALREHYGRAFPLFMRWVLQQADEWPTWREQYRTQVRKLVAQSPNNVAERLAAYFAAVLFTMTLVHHAFYDADWPMPWMRKAARRQLMSLWDAITGEVGGADTDVRALQAIRDWAGANPQRFWGRHQMNGYTQEPIAPSQGWLGRWDAGDDWPYIAFNADALRKFLLEREFRPDEVLPALTGRTDENGKPWVTYKNVRWGKGSFAAQDKMFVISRAAFEAAAPPD